MPASTLIIKYAFGAIWLVALPLALSWAVVAGLSGAPIGEPQGPVQHLLAFVRDQPIPAGIVLFTLFEVTLWSFRHDLPLSDKLGLSGRHGVPRRMRRDYEAASQLLEESERLLSARWEELRSELPPPRLDDLRSALDALRQAMASEPFDEGRFERALGDAGAAAELLEPWRKGALREYAESIAIAVAIAVLLRAVVVEAFKIPSASMLPTLQIRDHIFVNKSVYGPVVPFTELRLFDHLPPARGDIIVFEFPDTDPNAETQNYIKRVIAVPGDTLEVVNGHPVLNGWKVPFCRAGTLRSGARVDVEFLGPYAYLTRFESELFAYPPDGDDGGEGPRQGPYVVRPGEVWVLGDNRDNSHDSRRWFGGRGGGVPFPKIKGRAMFVWFPTGRLFVNVMGEPVLTEDAPAELAAGVQRCLSARPSTAEATPPPGR